ncbi:MAG: Tetrahydromethanopterin S-methyltransferase subunit A 1 [Candidatus Thorarchaeota archaeon AB_25]|nr:MAG: Tetrahydromethanopterin S-methyltransferase subunit A 1 [Candidatus Thorarchaeota archaeon AB_25]
MSSDHNWPPISGDFEVGDPSHCVAICTLGKKLNVDTKYAIIGTCKTENIGIERVILNIISNPKIRYLILSGPEVPGHFTGRSMRALYQNGVDPETRRIIDAEGAIPYIENIPLEGIEQFREQVELVDMINTNDPAKIDTKANELSSKNPGEYSKGAMWVEFKVTAKKSPKRSMGADVMLLPEYGIILESSSSLVTSQQSNAIVSENPSSAIIEVQDDGTGTILFGREV